ncbi:MAG: hypothetical protein LAP40_02990 [Acidobacteriia bacterium]|nr:hypothetical protein [Terriglobia bacterium]
MSFTAAAGTVTAAQSATLTATLSGKSTTTTLTLVTLPVISSVQCSPGLIGSSDTTTCTVTLASAAPAAGSVISLSSNSALLTVPATMAVTAGSTTVSFLARAGSLTADQTSVVTATYNGSSQTATIQLAWQPKVTSLVCDPASLSSGGVAVCTVTLTVAPATTAVAVALSTNNPALTIPASVSVPTGSTSAFFNALSGAVASNQTVVLTATLNGGSQTATLNLTPGSGVVLQTFSNQTLNSKYFFRQVSLGTDGAGNLTDARTMYGTMTFDGAGHYSFNAQVIQGNTTPTPQSGSGTYSLDAAGILSLDNPVRAGDKISARYGAEAIVGSTTESADLAYDMFAAIPAPTTGTSNGSLSGSYWTADLQFAGSSFTNAQNSMVNLTSSGAGTFQDTTISGHAAYIAGGQVQTQPITGAIYSMAGDGTGTAIFGVASNLLSGLKTVYLSQDGNVFLAGSANGGTHEMMIGIKAAAPATNSTWSGAFWTAGLRQSGAAVAGFAGSAVASGSGSLYVTERLKILGTGNLDLTKVDPYSLNADGSGTSALAQVGLGAGGNAFLGSSIDNSDASGYEIYFGVRMPGVLTTQGGSSSSLSLNPQGVQNVASYAPTGNPIAPGELIYLYVSGLTVTTQTATPPYPSSLGGVSVLINGAAAPIYLVSPTELVVLVPYATVGPTASIEVLSGGVTSNAVFVPVAATAPGIFSQSQNGSGLGAIRHADYSVVTADNPAHSGEVVLIYLTGLGAVSPALADGAGSTGNPLNLTVAQPGVQVGGQAATVLFSGMSAYPGLYQINAQLPTIPAGATALPLVISTANATTDEVDIAVAP